MKHNHTRTPHHGCPLRSQPAHAVNQHSPQSRADRSALRLSCTPRRISFDSAPASVEKRDKSLRQHSLVAGASRKIICHPPKHDGSASAQRQLPSSPSTTPRESGVSATRPGEIIFGSRPRKRARDVNIPKPVIDEPDVTDATNATTVIEEAGATDVPDAPDRPDAPRAMDTGRHRHANSKRRRTLPSPPPRRETTKTDRVPSDGSRVASRCTSTVAVRNAVTAALQGCKWKPCTNAERRATYILASARLAAQQDIRLVSAGHPGEVKAQVLPHLVKEVEQADVLGHMLDQGLLAVLGMWIKPHEGGRLVAGDIQKAVVDLLSGLPLDKAMMEKQDNRRVARLVCALIVVEKDSGLAHKARALHDRFTELGAFSVEPRHTTLRTNRAVTRRRNAPSAGMRWRHGRRQF